MWQYVETLYKTHTLACHNLPHLATIGHVLSQSATHYLATDCHILPHIATHCHTFPYLIIIGIDFILVFFYRNYSLLRCSNILSSASYTMFSSFGHTLPHMATHYLATNCHILPHIATIGHTLPCESWIIAIVG